MTRNETTREAHIKMKSAIWVLMMIAEARWRSADFRFPRPCVKSLECITPTSQNKKLKVTDFFSRFTDGLGLSSQGKPVSPVW